MPTKRRLRILFVSAKPIVDFSTFYLPVTSVWRRLYSWDIRWATGSHVNCCQDETLAHADAIVAWVWEIAQKSDLKWQPRL
jgi:hypothetical protein